MCLSRDFWCALLTPAGVNPPPGGGRRSPGHERRAGEDPGAVHHVLSRGRGLPDRPGLHGRLRRRLFGPGRPRGESAR